MSETWMERSLRDAAALRAAYADLIRVTAERDRARDLAARLEAELAMYQASNRWCELCGEAMEPNEAVRIADSWGNVWIGHEGGCHA